MRCRSLQRFDIFAALYDCISPEDDEASVFAPDLCRGHFEEGIQAKLMDLINQELPYRFLD